MDHAVDRLLEPETGLDRDHQHVQHVGQGSLDRGLPGLDLVVESGVGHDRQAGHTNAGQDEPEQSAETERVDEEDEHQPDRDETETDDSDGQETFHCGGDHDPCLQMLVANGLHVVRWVEPPTESAEAGEDR